MEDLVQRLVSVVPSQRQIAYQQTEFYAFIHFTINTFTGREWGDGTEEESLFNPSELDVTQWVASIKAAGMRGLLLTCKHHDGFCLWPSRYTTHTIAASPYQEGKGDIVKEVAQACQKENIRFGVYLSPWDRHNATYGKGKEYDDYFVNQLTELLTQYGDIFVVWFDGACGEGANGRKQAYDWDRYVKTIRQWQPNACINVCGPDVRWCGNEAGHTRDSEWSVVPKRTTETERIAKNSQQADNEQFRQREINAADIDLGSRLVLKDETELVWYPAEVNTSIRPGWFYHEDEDEKLKSIDELFEIYLKSVGGNATFLLNIPPNKEGLFAPGDVQRLYDLGKRIRDTFAINLLEDAYLTSSSCLNGHGIENVRTDDDATFFETEKGASSCRIDITFPECRLVSYIVLKENIQRSQRIEKYSVLDNEGTVVQRGTVVGYKRIIRLEKALQAKQLTIQLDMFRVSATLLFVGVY